MLTLSGTHLRAEAKKATFQPRLPLLLLIMLGLFIAGYMLPQLLGGVLLSALGANELVQEAVVNNCMPLFTTLVAIWYCTKIEKRSLQSMGFTRRRFAANYLLGYLGGCLPPAATVGICWLLGAVQLQPGQPSGYILLFFVAFLIQGMSEEAALRGCLMVSAANKASTPVAVLVSAAFFTVPHIFLSDGTPVYLINVFLLGILFALLLIRTGSLWSACGAHSGFNFFVRCILFTQSYAGASLVNVKSNLPGKQLLGGDDYGYLASVILTSLVIVCIALVSFLPRRPKGLQRNNA